MPTKLKIGVLFGGKSPEHDVSTISGGEVIKNLDRSKYEVIPIFISKSGTSWQIGENKKTLGSPASLKKLIDIAFIAMHGPFGEDGTIQGFLEMFDIPYTGSGVLASSLGMDKIYSRKLFIQAGIIVPKYVLVNKKTPQSEILSKLKFPVFVKPKAQGSSVGVSKVKNKKDLARALKTAFSYGDEVIIEEFLAGTEITCAILGNAKPKALPLVEIVTKKEFFDLEAKYDAKLTDEIVPARISRDLTKKAQDAAIRAYETIGCQAFGRVDMIIASGKPYVLEVNTIPGLTPVSLFPKAAASALISYQKLLDKIISFSLGK
ncbi:MAG: D-alanine--D-alanine ligase [Candidatus Curtissbacteria bacterium]